MNTIDYVYRLNPKNPSVKPSPPDAPSARRTLEDGNRVAKWMESCRTSDVSQGEPRYVVQCNGLQVGMNRARGEAEQRLRRGGRVLRCPGAHRDALRPGINDLFVIRVAGNVLGDVCMGSIESRSRPCTRASAAS